MTQCPVSSMGQLRKIPSRSTALRGDPAQAPSGTLFVSRYKSGTLSEISGTFGAGLTGAKRAKLASPLRCDLCNSHHIYDVYSTPTPSPRHTTHTHYLLVGFAWDLVGFPVHPMEFHH